MAAYPEDGDADEDLLAAADRQVHAQKTSPSPVVDKLGFPLVSTPPVHSVPPYPPRKERPRPPGGSASQRMPRAVHGEPDEPKEPPGRPDDEMPAG